MKVFVCSAFRQEAKLDLVPLPKAQEILHTFSFLLNDHPRAAKEEPLEGGAPDAWSVEKGYHTRSFCNDTETAAHHIILKMVKYFKMSDLLSIFQNHIIKLQVTC